MKHISHYFLSIFLLSSNYAFCIEDTQLCKDTPVLKDTVPIIVQHLDLASISSLLRACKTHKKFYEGIPLHWNNDSYFVTKEEYETVQFGASKLLQENPVFCKNLNENEHLNALVHYAQTNNTTMVEQLIKNENSINRETRIKVLVFFDYISDAYTTNLQDLFNLDNIIAAYKGLEKNNNKIEPFHLIAACELQTIPVIKILIKNNVYMNAIGGNSNSALHAASICPSIENVRLLLNNYADVNVCNCDKNTPLFLAAQRNNIPAAQLLLQKGAFVNCKNNKGWTPLHAATNNNHYRMMKLLIKNGADFTIQAHFGKTPLDCAQTPQAKQILKDAGAQECIIS